VKIIQIFAKTAHFSKLPKVQKEGGKAQVINNTSGCLFMFQMVTVLPSLFHQGGFTFSGGKMFYCYNFI
jgi:hypothetical protein